MPCSNHAIEGDWRRDEDRLDDRVDYDKDRVENSFSNAGQDIEQFPDDAARWTGRKVGEVEDIPGDVRNDYDDAKYGIENKFDNAVSTRSGVREGKKADRK